MAVFYDTGGGDIYGGPDRESIIESMRKDCGDDDFDEDDIFEVPSTKEMRGISAVGILSSLEHEYDPSLGAYCVASENC